MALDDLENTHRQVAYDDIGNGTMHCPSSVGIHQIAIHSIPSIVELAHISPDIASEEEGSSRMDRGVLFDIEDKVVKEDEHFSFTNSLFEIFFCNYREALLFGASLELEKTSIAILEEGSHSQAEHQVQRGKHSKRGSVHLVVLN